MDKPKDKHTDKDKQKGKPKEYPKGKDKHPPKDKPKDRDKDRDKHKPIDPECLNLKLVQQIERHECCEKEFLPDTNVLIVNINRLKKDSYIDANVSDDTIRIAALYIQDTIIERVIGTCLFNRIREIICEDVIDKHHFRYYKLLVDEYIFPIFAYGIPAEISIPLSFKSRNAGIVQNNSQDVSQTGLGDIKYLNQYYQNKKDYYIKRAIDFLLRNTAHYPELKGCKYSTCGSQSPMHKDYSNPLNLKKSWIAPQKRYRRKLR